EERRDVLGIGAREIEPGCSGLSGRRADDPRVDETSADRGADLTRGRRGDGVRVDEDPFESGDRARYVERRMRGTDRKDELTSPRELLHRARVLETGLLRPCGRLGTPAGGDPEHVPPGGEQVLADRGAHLAWMEQPDRH